MSVSAPRVPPASCQGREEIQEDDLFTALEKIQQERLGGSMNSSQSTDETVRMNKFEDCRTVSMCMPPQGIALPVLLQLCRG
jgi:hypothetical protein